jgi:ABC-type branched-subunit amino acid transport system substrate-binding protein
MGFLRRRQNVLNRFGSVALVAMLITGFAIAGGLKSASGSSVAPIKIMLEGTFTGSTSPSFVNYPEAAAAVTAYLTPLNKAGGINHHRVDIVTCSDEANPDVAAACAREAVADKVVAVISPLHSATGLSILPILQAAHIAFIDQPFTSPDYTNPMSFTVGSCCAGVFGAAAIALVHHHVCKKIGAFDYDIAASSQLVASMNKAVKPLGREVGAVVVNPTASTFAGTVAAVQSGGFNCMVPAIAQTQILPLMTALQAAGVKIFWAQYGASLTPTELKAMSSAGANGSLVVTQWADQSTNTPLMKRLNSNFAAAKVPFTDITVGGWTDARLFDLVARSISGKVTAATFLTAIRKAHGLQLGTIPPYSTQHPIKAAGYNRVFDPYAYVQKLENGVLKPESTKPINASAAY